MSGSVRLSLRTVSRLTCSSLISCLEALSRASSCWLEASISLAVCTRLSTMARRPSRSFDWPSFSRHVGEALGIAVGGAGGGVDHRHHLLDLVHHLAADIVDALGQPRRRADRSRRFVEVGVGERAVLLQRLVDLLVERGVVAGGVGVPDLVIARRCRLAQRLDLAERDVGERHRAFVLVGVRRHR